MNDLDFNINEINYSIKSEIGRNLFIARKALRLSHVELVQTTRLTRPIISTIENGTSNPTLNSITKLSSALYISNEMLMMTKTKFGVLQKLLKQTFSHYMLQQSELYIPKKEWNKLLKYSETATNIEIGRVASTCAKIISINYPDQIKSISQNMVLGGTLGVMYQSDGFKYGLNFGAWLGKNFSR